MKRTFEWLALIGEVMVVIGAAVWLTGWIGANYVYAAGALAFAVGRFAEKNVAEGLTLRRLYAQRNFGVAVLLLSAFLMFVEPGFYWGYYVGRQLWRLPFAIFVVLEAYTAFRIPYVEKREK